LGIGTKFVSVYSTLKILFAITENSIALNFIIILASTIP
jgi:hypothetical protein